VDPSAESGLSYRQAVEEVLRVLTGQWVVAVLAALAAGPLRFKQLLDEINAVEQQVGRRTHDVPLSARVLARTLDRMAEDGLVVRHDETRSLPYVWYELTSTGRSLLGALRPLAQWARRYRDSHPPAAEG